MQILGQVYWRGKQKEIAIKEEDAFFKYYILELIGVYAPKMESSSIIFKEDNNFSKETNLAILKLLNKNIILKMLKKKDNNECQIIGNATIKRKTRKIVAKKEGEVLKFYYLVLIGIYTFKVPREVIIFKENVRKEEEEEEFTISDLEKEEIKMFLRKINIISKFEKKIQNNVKNINIKQEVDMDTRVTDMSNLEQVLRKNGKMPKLEAGDAPLKMGIVESDDLKNLKNKEGEREQGHSSRYEAVMITKRGKVYALDLENDTQEGNNPTEKNYQVKQNRDVKSGDVLTRLKLGEGTLGIEKGQYGEVEVYHSPRKTIGGKSVEGNKSLDRQLETSNSKNVMVGTDIETLKLAQENNDGYRSVEDGYQEIEEHQKENPICEEKKVEDLDGDRNTSSHTHVDDDFVVLSSGEKVSYKQLATRWGFFKDGKPDEKFIKKKITEKKKEEEKVDDILAELDEEYEDPRAPDRGR